MQWRGGRQSGNVEDQRGMGTGGQVAVGGGILGVIALLLNFLLGGEVDPSQIPQAGGGGGQQQTQSTQGTAEEESRKEFVSVVLGYTEDVWNQVYSERGKQYQEPRLVVFRESVQSGCGGASAQSGPFYCPADQKVYIDLSFYDQLAGQFGAKGDFALAYVIAHEVGHHIQTLSGTSEKMARLRQQVSQEQYNAYSVRMELQADFLAGLWAHHMKGKTFNGKPVLDIGDAEEAMNAAQQIGDDQLTGGRVSAENFTHGTSAQRMYWFRKGYETGDINQGDTFNATRLE